MYKNQLQELAQRSCFNLPSYGCTRKGPDHAPRFKASVNFNGEIFEGPNYCTTLRQAEHSAAEVALNTLSSRGPSRSLASRVIDETGVYKNLLQESVHKAGLNLPVYSNMRSGPAHLPIFTCIVEIAGMNFTGESAKTKKQAEKNAAMAAWYALKQMTKPNFGSTSQTIKETESSEEQGVIVTRALSNIRPEDEKKPVKQRDQNQRGKMVIVSSPYNFYQYIPPVYPTQQQNQQQNCFLALLPSLPPTTSKTLPPTSSTDLHHPSMYNRSRRTQFNIKEISPPLEEHHKDEEEWLHGKSDIKEKYTEKDTNNANSSSVIRSKHTYKTGAQKTQIRSRPIGPHPRVLRASGVHHAHRMAPAVHIRSVIPVCAAPPPMRSSSSNLPTPQMKEILSSVSSQTAEDVSEAISKFNKLKI